MEPPQAHESENEPTPVRRCVVCKDEKPYTTALWPYVRGKPKGSVCRLCSRVRKRNFDKNYRALRVAARAKTLADMAATPLSTPAKGGDVATTTPSAVSGAPVTKLEVAKALREGASYVNDHARRILDTVFGYANDPASPHHEWSIRLLADRVIPKKLYEDLGGQAAGTKVGQGSPRPQITFIVQQASQPEAAVRVFEHPPITIGASNNGSEPTNGTPSAGDDDSES